MGEIEAILPIWYTTISNIQLLLTILTTLTKVLLAQLALEGLVAL